MIIRSQIGKLFDNDKCGDKDRRIWRIFKYENNDSNAIIQNRKHNVISSSNENFAYWYQYIYLKSFIWFEITMTRR